VRVAKAPVEGHVSDIALMLPTEPVTGWISVKSTAKTYEGFVADRAAEVGLMSIYTNAPRPPRVVRRMSFNAEAAKSLFNERAISLDLMPPSITRKAPEPKFVASCVAIVNGIDTEVQYVDRSEALVIVPETVWVPGRPGPVPVHAAPTEIVAFVRTIADMDAP
jgi:hypothetical protein